MAIPQLIVYFSGILDGQEGQELSPGDDDLSEEIRSHITAPSGSEIKWFGRTGALTTNRGVDQAVSFIKASSQEAGHIILYGYSAGGVNALDVCRKLRQEAPSTLVDLLITVDVAARGNTPKLDRSVPENVVVNVNFFQKSKQLSGSVGGLAVALSPKTSVQNIQMSFMESGHTKIRTTSFPQVLSLIRKGLSLRDVVETARSQLVTSSATQKASSP
jgi:hypothetical protein